MYRTVFVILIGLTLYLAMASSALADGIPLKGKHVDADKTVLKLTTDQMRLIRHRRIAKISLTQQQQTALQQEAGFAPKQIQVWSLAVTKDSCTCEALNVAVATGGGRIEVVHSLLGSNLNDRFKHGRKAVARRS